MTREEFTENRSALTNEGWVPFGKMSEERRKLLKSAPMGEIQVLDAHGERWCDNGRATFYHGHIYRIKPSWTGPTEPPKPRYVDVPVQKGVGSLHYVHSYPNGAIYSLSQAPSLIYFAGFVYDGKIETRLKFRVNTAELIVPDAVRFHTTE